MTGTLEAAPRARLELDDAERDGTACLAPPVPVADWRSDFADPLPLDTIYDPARPWTPEQRLLAAIFLQAVADLSDADPYVRADARAFFKCPGEESAPSTRHGRELRKARRRQPQAPLITLDVIVAELDLAPNRPQTLAARPAPALVQHA